ncbi:hypothetical protein [Bacterioplanoides sp.]|uniref:hypothetical protein n=1 Tax=Bacterioplanoides sp. TaxID=2066072 RepID=UPI003B598BEC
MKPEQITERGQANVVHGIVKAKNLKVSEYNSLEGRVCCDSCEGNGIQYDDFDEDHYIESDCDECGGLGHVEAYEVKAV